MNNIETRSGEEQGRCFGLVKSDGSCCPVSIHHSELVSTRAKSSGSPLCTSVVPDTTVQALGSTRAASSSPSCTWSPDKIGNHQTFSSSDRHSSDATLVEEPQKSMSHCMIQDRLERGHDFFPELLSGTPVLSTSSETPWRSPSSTPGRKRDLEQSFKDSLTAPNAG